MGGIVEVLSATRATRHGVPVTDIKSDPGGGAIVTAEQSTPAGYDSLPLPGDYAALSAAAGTGRQTTVGYLDTRNTPKAGAGETRTYARRADGTIAVEVWLKNDDTCLITNGAGSFQLEADGTFIINGLRITPDGNLITASGVNVDTHGHPQGADSDGDSQKETDAPTPG